MYSGAWERWDISLAPGGGGWQEGPLGLHTANTPWKVLGVPCSPDPKRKNQEQRQSCRSCPSVTTPCSGVTAQRRAGWLPIGMGAAGGPGRWPERFLLLLAA